MAKARARDCFSLLVKVSLTACALVALALASAQKAPAGELPPLKQLVEAALRSADADEPKTAPAPAPAQPTPEAVAPAATPVAAVAPKRTVMAPIPDRLPTLRNDVNDVEVGKTASLATKGGESNCLATAIYFEARGESAKGQKAVAEVILARTRVPGRPKSICGVVYEGSWRETGCQFSFTCDDASDVARPDAAWKQACTIAAAAMRARGKKGTIVKGATFYHADYVSPDWASRMVKVAQIGSHIFYRPQRGHLF